MVLRPHRITGFTLVELIMVIVVLSILALGTSRYIVNSSESFVVSAERAKLIATARVAVEQVVRRLRNALPNSIRVSASGHCLEYFPVLEGRSTTAPLLPAQTVINTSSGRLTGGVDYAVVAAFSPAELYLAGTPASAVISAVAGLSNNAVTLSASHTFARTSPTQRIYLVGEPQRFCITGGELRLYSGYGIDVGSISDTPPGSATSTLVTQDLNAGNSSFSYSGATLTRNALVQVDLAFTRAGEGVEMSHEVQIRNVP